MPFGIQPIHLIVIAIVALLIFGPARLPEIGRGVGKAMMELRRSFREMSDSVMQEANRPAGAQPAAEPVAEKRGQPAPEAVVNCPQCGAVNPQLAHFCNSCGAKLIE